MIFYHYTCVEHLETIIEAGYLKLCEANVYPPSYFQETDKGIQISSEYLEGVKTGQSPVDENELKGPHVVWLYKKRLTGKGPKMLLSTGTMNVSGSLVPVTIDKSRNKKNIKAFDIKAFLGESVKINLEVFFENLNLGGKEFYFKIKNGNISRYKNLQLKIVLKNKYILENFQIIDSIDNCYYVK